jgi:hypothetical protein
MKWMIGECEKKNEYHLNHCTQKENAITCQLQTGMMHLERIDRVENLYKW